MSDLLERIIWTIRKNDRPRWFKRLSGYEVSARLMAEAVVREIETTHRIINPEDVTEAMVVASFHSLPEHYSPPDMSRRPWHALKARRRFTAMARAAKKLVE